ncbi:hypothetical protein [Amphiplicatus metriothermophilus]|uniref:DUF1579 domain-containing protein n=1 Tax=Amphiplicatus metriothermophilus TaxID=1519374 RepID=A0A239Q083_9PROT|nr:hypothetical protein [Amphiplicatus metriothermophilus]MBB5518155.1 hypothetical protein [Amphiplicatus metriothermophilus]SNT75317.1 hypothetical protein SAMN06297382_2658 [Amphiplicatus metriothermophilus]
MRRRILAAALMGLWTAGAGAAAGGEPSKTAVAAYEPMAPFAPLAGSAWRGEGAGPDGAPIVDTVVYDFILEGRALQSTHRLADGSYGGRTIIFYDEGAKEYVFHYFTTAGFHTTGTVRLEEDGFEAVETVHGHETIAQVRARATIGEDALTVDSLYVDRNGVEKPGRTMTYRRLDARPKLFADGE